MDSLAYTSEMSISITVWARSWAVSCKSACLGSISGHLTTTTRHLFPAFVLCISRANSVLPLSASPHHLPVQNAHQFKGSQMHAKDFRDASIADGKRVLVIGAGKTALVSTCILPWLRRAGPGPNMLVHHTYSRHQNRVHRRCHKHSQCFDVLGVTSVPYLQVLLLAWLLDHVTIPC